jgi:predicted transposase YbfD/YdcC
MQWLHAFEKIKDPRNPNHRNYRHQLTDILALTLLATLSGADDWQEIQTFGESNQKWLEDHFDFSNGVPSHDTLARVFQLLNPLSLQEAFQSWIQSICQHKKDLIAIDGKTLRHSYDKGSHGPIHMISAWSHQNQMVFGQLKTHEKSNEITAIPKLLRLLDLSGCIVSIDAMGCQTAIAETIVDSEGDYVLAVKGNQKVLYEQVMDFFKTAEQEKYKNTPYFEHVDAPSKNHGRIEARRYTLCPLPHYFADTLRWKGLKGIGRIERRRELDGKISREVSYSILSFSDDIHLFSQSVRSHWQIENALHWSLDVAFREDDSRIRKANSPENMAIIRHMSLNMLKNEKTYRQGIKGKCKRAGWDKNFLLKVLAVEGA